MQLTRFIEQDDDLDPDFVVPLIMTAAGLAKTFAADTLRPYAEAANVAVAGSFTLAERPGNRGSATSYMEDPGFTINAMGMQNKGSSVIEPSPFLNVIASIAGMTIGEFGQLAQLYQDWGAGIELNLGCPNIEGKGVFAFDPTAVDSVLSLLDVSGTAVSGSLGLKLSVYSDPGRLKEIADVIADHHKTVDYVAVCNTFPNGRAYLPNGDSAIRTHEMGVRGGIGGEALKLFSLSNAAEFREFLPEDIAVLRVGGVSTGRDVWESVQVGCDGVQIHSAIAQKGISVIQKIKEEYIDLYRS